MFSSQFASFDDDVDSQPRRSPLSKLLTLASIAGLVILGTTFAANINLGGNQSIEFGQGIVQTTACSGNTELGVLPQAKFTNSSGTGAWYFKSITVSNIPLGCDGSDFLISAYGSTSATPLALFDTTGTNIVVYDSSSGFQVGGGMSGYTVSSGSDSFTVTFTNPVATTDTVYRITMQTGLHTVGVSEQCASNGQRVSGGPCRVGDIGTGGGTIFYVSATTFTATGAACSPNCRFLEFAPKGWASISDWPNNITYGGTIIGARTNANDDPILVWSDGGFTGQAAGSIAVGEVVGTGYNNTQQIKNNTTAGVHDERFGFNAALGYVGNSGTSTVGQWFLPSINELNELCKFARGDISGLGDQSVQCSRSVGTLNASYGFNTVGSFYLSSTYDAANPGQTLGYNMEFFTNPLRNQYYSSYGNPIRPIRTF
jgi:hypothetical protein